MANEFASIEAISKNRAPSENPWVLVSRLLEDVQASSRDVIKAEEKRHKDLNKAWKEEMDNKAALFPQMATSKKWWQVYSISFMVLPFMISGFGKLFGHRDAVVNFGKRFFSDLTGDKLDSLCQRGADIMQTMGSHAVKEGSEASQLYYSEIQTHEEWATQYLQKTAEQEQGRVQAARDQKRGLDERTLEIIKTQVQALSR